MSKQTRVLVVDDHALIREGILRLLSSQSDLQIVGQAREGQQSIEMALALKPDLILMDLTMPGVGGLEATEQILDALPDCKVVMLIEHDDEDSFFEAVQVGALGYVTKGTATETLVPMVRRVLRGEAALNGHQAAKMLSAFKLVAGQAANCPLDEELPVLTPREQEVLRCVADGRMDREIAEQLSISLSTVKTHVRSILSKMNVTSRHQAALRALRRGLIRLPG